MDFKQYIDPLQWDQDESPDFTDGQGYWAKINNAVLEFGYAPNALGENTFLIRVRTGDKANPTAYVSSYKLEIDGVNVPMVLDTTRQNVPSGVFGGSHLGWIKGVMNIPNTSAKDFKFTATKQFGGVDAIQVIDPLHVEEYQRGLAEGSKGMYTQADLDKAKAQGIAEGKQIQLDYSKADLNLAP